MTKKENVATLSVSKLKERGWTEAGIRKFLGEPDILKTNPIYKCAAPMKLYNEDRVVKVESTSEFAEFKSRHNTRQGSAQKAVQTKKQKAIEYAQSIDVNIPKLPWSVVLNKAIDSYNDFHGWLMLERGHEYIPAALDSDPMFLARICTNYLRHECTNYEDQIFEMFGKVGVQEAHDIIQTKINEKIYNTYPQLRDMMQSKNI